MNNAEEQVKVLREALAQWREAYAAFRGAFDTPQMRRDMSDDYSEDARKRMRTLDDAIGAALEATAGAAATPAAVKEVRGGWRPIATAPRDGTTVLCFWTTEAWPVDADNYGLARFEAGSWRNPTDAQHEYRDPSHWQPLTPPATPAPGTDGVALPDGGRDAG